MRFSKYPSGTILEVSAENPDKFPVKDIERFIQLDTYLYHNKQEEAEYKYDVLSLELWVVLMS